MKLSMLAVVAALSAGTAGMALSDELRIGMAAPENTPWGTITHKFADKVAELTGGELTVSVYFNNELGDEQTMARQLARGRLDMAELSNVASSLLVPEYGLLLSPYAFDSLKQADCVADGNLAETFGESFRSAGAVFLTPVEVGNMTIMSKTPIRTPSDLQNVKIRTSPTQSDTYFIQAAGGAAVPLGTADSLPALKTGQVTALTTPIVIGVAGGYAAAAPQVTRTNHGHQIGTILVSAQRWDGLSEENRAALTEAAKVFVELRPLMRETEEAMLKKVAESGGNVVEPTPDEMTQWKALAPEVRERMMADIGGNSVAIWDAIEAAKATCGQ
ncbi:TRAP transporter substrate-binding protein [Paracoccus sp. (in: a-proteobacteria)]|uniref:TRAP transporter substrate-binding protein n=1 Tax=Paracoccus sp. TaxID=267 RepID=UPI003A8B5B63